MKALFIRALGEQYERLRVLETKLAAVTTDLSLETPEGLRWLQETEEVQGLAVSCYARRIVVQSAMVQQARVLCMTVDGFVHLRSSGSAAVMSRSSSRRKTLTSRL